MRRIPRLLRNPRWALGLIGLLAAVLRLVAIDRLPPGLYHDEAYNGLDALNVLRGETPCSLRPTTAASRSLST